MLYNHGPYKIEYETLYYVPSYILSKNRFLLKGAINKFKNKCNKIAPVLNKTYFRLRTENFQGDPYLVSKLTDCHPRVVSGLKECAGI